MKKNCLVWIGLAVFCLTHLNMAFAQQQQVDIASSPNPLGSGARALGMGGAFIGVADDATAASWNPGGLVQLKKPEISLVISGFHRSEDNTLCTDPRSETSQHVSGEDINYLSIAYPFNLLNRNMVLSLNYQHLYDFTAKWNYATSIASDAFEAESLVDYKQSGRLSALGLAYCIQMTPRLSFGLTLNSWDDGLLNNQWEENYHLSDSQTVILPPDMPPEMAADAGSPSLTEEYRRQERYSFSGFNFNVGMLWRATDRLTIGAVFKSPFTADLRHEKRIQDKTTDFQGEVVDISEFTYEEELDMPMSYGLGVAYRFSDHLTLSADIYRTGWDDFTIRDSDGNTFSPVTNDDSEIDATTQVRVGGEYLIIHPSPLYVIPIRAGGFYDPLPAKGNPDDVWGLSMGSGLVIGRYVFDIAFQYRFGNGVGGSAVQYYDADFSQDVGEVMIYTSLIIHF